MNLNDKLGIAVILLCSILTGCSSNIPGYSSSTQSNSTPKLSYQFVKDDSKLSNEEIKSNDMNSIIFVVNNYINSLNTNRFEDYMKCFDSTHNEQSEKTSWKKDYFKAYIKRYITKLEVSNFTANSAIVTITTENTKRTTFLSYENNISCDTFNFVKENGQWVIHEVKNISKQPLK